MRNKTCLNTRTRAKEAGNNISNIKVEERGGEVSKSKAENIVEQINEECKGKNQRKSPNGSKNAEARGKPRLKSFTNLQNSANKS